MNSVVIARGRECIFDDIKSASNFWHRLKGLLGTDSLGLKYSGNNDLESSQGLLISPCSQIHTFGMRYKIDVVFISRALKVINIVAGLGPNHVVRNSASYYVLELPAGGAERVNLRNSDQLYICFEGRQR